MAVRFLSVRRLAAALPGRALDLLYPRRCVGCGRFDRLLCEPCRLSMVPATGPGRCPNCAAAWKQTGNCPRCFHWETLDGGRAAFEMEGPARQLIHTLKYLYCTDAAGVMAGLMGPLWDGSLQAALPVPLHPSRKRRRGFNQAELIVEALGWPQAPGRLRRIRKTSTQVGLHLRERRANTAGAFAYEGEPLAGRAVAVVDDVITSGATADECARVLRDHGASRVIAIAFARASYRPDSTGPIDD